MSDTIIMITLLKKIISCLGIAICMVCPTSCMHDSFDDCGVYLEFIYNYNMGYIDAFASYVPTVDVFVFNKEGEFLFTLQATLDQLINHKRMFLGHDLPFGTYQILTIGGLGPDFIFSDRNGNELKQGITTIEEVQLALRHDSDEISHEFSNVWFGYPITVEYEADLSLWPLYLIKNTNRFNLVLTYTGDSRQAIRNDGVVYTFEIHAPEEGVYSWINSAIDMNPIIYMPFEEHVEGEPGSLSESHINTCRLFSGEDYDYRLKIKDTRTQEVLWEQDLIFLLSKTKPPSRPDGTVLPLQEYLDRQSDWNLVVLYSEVAGGQGGFTAVKVWINGWLVWEHDIEV